MTMSDTFERDGLPDPRTQPEFYRDVTVKRFLAFLVDTLAIILITVIIIPLTAFTALFFLGFLGWIVAFVYRVVTMANSSATPGMRLMGIEFRNQRGERLDPATGFAHVTLFMITFSMVIPQIASIIMMLTSERGQGLHDMLLGTAAINRPARG